MMASCNTMNDTVFFGSRLSENLFIQLVDEHDMKLMEQEVAVLEELTGNKNWCVLAVPVNDWNQELTPWKADPVFGRQGFGSGAAQTLYNLTEQIILSIEKECPPVKRYILCGYSLAGLFALWAAYQTDVFSGIVAASPSVWYPDWLQYAEGHTVKTKRVYLSLGEKEERVKNPVMAAVGNGIREQYRLLTENGVACRLDWNPGNHFVDSDRRMAKGMAWMLDILQQGKTV
ncbi:MAG: hypothetical protein IJ056_03550 [Acidaminococcaceae bacterium]|nr:hypothetical protein [Acidaminococcaceae bacterium]